MKTLGRLWGAVCSQRRHATTGGFEGGKKHIILYIYNGNTIGNDEKPQIFGAHCSFRQTCDIQTYIQ